MNKQKRDCQSHLGQKREYTTLAIEYIDGGLKKPIYSFVVIFSKYIYIDQKQRIC